MKRKFIPYPLLSDKDFYKKIYYKKEFNDTIPPPNPDPSDQSKETIKKLYPKDRDFQFLPSQEFVRNFISESTPYNGILLMHTTGTGKTCAGIGIAERFRERALNTGNKILIIAKKSIQGEFYKTIYNYDKFYSRKNEKQILQCTGKAYEIDTTEYISKIAREKKINSMIKDVYEIHGRDVLRNKLVKKIGWNEKEFDISEKIKNEISEMFSNRVIIIDEIHNRINTSKENDNFPLTLRTILRYSNNIKLILMSATPMTNMPSEIVIIINFLRLVNKLPIVKKSEFFDSDENLTKNGKEKFKNFCKGYVSYVRGEDPPRFPYRLENKEHKLSNAKYTFNKKKIKNNLKSTKLIYCNMSKLHYDNFPLTLRTIIRNIISEFFCWNSSFFVS